jgi:hypothetical protein
MDDAPQIAAARGTITLTNEQLQMLIEGAKQPSNAGMTAKDLAEAFSATQKRENPSAPMVSTYNPKGENIVPRPTLRAKTLQNGVELGADTLTWEEIEALNVLPPGEFMVAKANGTRIKFTVNIVTGMDGERVERVEIHFPSKDEHRHDHRGMFEYCVDVLEQTGKAEDVARLRALHKELNALRG